MTDLFFDYELPHERIAQEPAEPRDAARLLVIRGDRFEHYHFRDLPELLSPGDLVVLNDTKVLPARLIGRRAGTGGKWECLFLREFDGGDWEVMSQTRGYPQPGERFITDSGLSLVLTGRTPERHWLMRPDRAGSPHELLTQFGHVPLPPYIRKGRSQAEDEARYQTVYANVAGSVAAPTAGLHITPQVLDGFSRRGIGTARVTLHVGLGTFAPVTVADPRQHAIHAEWCDVPMETVKAVERTRAVGGRVIAIGTTAVRSLESAARSGALAPFRGPTDLYIHPPYSFRAIDGLVTNFHLPRTTLLLLVQALTGSSRLKRAYEEAIREGYRFYSYGDAMVMIPDNA